MDAEDGEHGPWLRSATAQLQEGAIASSPDQACHAESITWPCRTTALRSAVSPAKVFATARFVEARVRSSAPSARRSCDADGRHELPTRSPADGAERSGSCRRPVRSPANIPADKPTATANTDTYLLVPSPFRGGSLHGSAKGSCRRSRRRHLVTNCSPRTGSRATRTAYRLQGHAARIHALEQADSGAEQHG